MSNPNRHHHHKPSLFWPLFLIAIGSVLLLSNLGILPPNAFSLLWRFWPLVLVIIGLDILFGRRSAAGSIITSIIAILLLGGVLAFLFFAQNIPELVEKFDTGSIKHSTIKHPLNEAQTAEVFIDWASGPARLYALSDSNNLVEGELNYFGSLSFLADTKNGHANVNIDSRRDQFFIDTGGFTSQSEAWEIGLHPQVALDLTLDAGSGPGEYDMTRLNVKSLNVDAGSGSLEIFLPEKGQIEGILDGGSGSIEIVLPEDMDAKIILDDGSGSFRPDERFTRKRTDDDNVIIWLTDDFVGADNYIELNIDQGSGSIKVD